METVNKVENINKPVPEPAFADYFMEAVWDKINNRSNLFVTNNEYKEKSGSILPWAIFINGHGVINTTIADITLQKFKDFLVFLENKIKTKLLIYTSCYAAGINSEIIYRSEKGIIDTTYTTYSFAIITTVLTDVTTAIGEAVTLEIDQGTLKIKTAVPFDQYLKEVTSSDIIDYLKIAEFFKISTFYLETLGLGSLAQIKFPQLPWFSVLDNTKVVSIGSILAKTRTKPLDIATFFTKKASVPPIGILLYTENVPFELIINTKGLADGPPDIISMIPGNATHLIKKISSTLHSLDSILNSLLGITGLIPQKLFIIDEITGKFSGTALTSLNKLTGIVSDVLLTCQNIVIKLTQEKNSIYFSYKDSVYKTINALTDKNPAQRADVNEIQEYEELLKQYGKKPITIVTPKLMEDLQKKADERFRNKMDSDEALQNIKEVLDTMPNDTVLHIPSISVICPITDMSCWWRMLLDILKYQSFGGHRIIWVDAIFVCPRCMRVLSNVIIDLTKTGLQIFSKNLFGENPRRIIKDYQENLNEDYIPTYEKIFDYFKKHQTIDESLAKNIEVRSVHELLTAESVGQIREMMQQNILKRDLIELEKSLNILNIMLKIGN
ncbi:MAG: hypothetical protein WA432_01730 [Candidatus Babeliaceae bacterium]